MKINLNRAEAQIREKRLKSIVSYNGGLNLIQDIYSTVIKENEKQVNSVE